MEASATSIGLHRVLRLTGIEHNRFTSLAQIQLYATWGLPRLSRLLELWLDTIATRPKGHHDQSLSFSP